MAELNPRQLLLVAVQPGRIALLRGIGESRIGRFPISVDAHVPNHALFDFLAALKLPCEVSVVFDNQGTVTPMHVLQVEVESGR
jgi:hypothetical protein